MPKFFVNNANIKNDKVYIENENFNHIKNVLRKSINDELNICNSETSENFICIIEEIMNNKIICKIVKKSEISSESNLRITIFQGLPKSEKMELVIQKSIELGANNIIPVEMKRCVVKLMPKDKIKKIERWKKVAEVAAKQCNRDIIPEISECLNIEQVCKNIEDYDCFLVAYENEKNNVIKNEIQKLKNKKYKKMKIGVLIGPEGGIDQTEIDILREKGAKIITLGNRILRTETVALAVTSILMYELGDCN